MRHYGIPEITNIVRNSYEGMSCRVVHGKDLTDSFQVRTGVRQGCLLSPFLFILALDWIMSTSTANRKNGIQWTPWKHLEDWDFADDVALLSHTQHQMQEKTTDHQCRKWGRWAARGDSWRHWIVLPGGDLLTAYVPGGTTGLSKRSLLCDQTIEDIIIFSSAFLVELRGVAQLTWWLNLPHSPLRSCVSSKTGRQQELPVMS